MRKSIVIVAALAVLGGLMMSAAPVRAQGEVMYVVNDKVGVGTATPQAMLDVEGGDLLVGTGALKVGTGLSGYSSYQFSVAGPTAGLLLERTLSEPFILLFTGPDTSGGQIRGLADGRAEVHEQDRDDGVAAGHLRRNVGIGVAAPTYPLQLANGAYVTAGGVWTNASSRAYKDDIQDLSDEAAEQTLEG